MLARPLRSASLYRWWWLAAAVLALAVVLAAACGGESSGTQAEPESANQNITVRDDLFEPNELRVQAGLTVTLNVKNEGEAVHTLRVAGPDNEYNTDDDTLADPEMIKPGATVAVVWTAPDEPGTYNFRCDYHPVETGTITVE